MKRVSVIVDEKKYQRLVRKELYDRFGLRSAFFFNVYIETQLYC